MQPNLIRHQFNGSGKEPLERWNFTSNLSLRIHFHFAKYSSLLIQCIVYYRKILWPYIVSYYIQPTNLKNAFDIIKCLSLVVHLVRVNLAWGSDCVPPRQLWTTEGGKETTASLSLKPTPILKPLPVVRKPTQVLDNNYLPSALSYPFFSVKRS